jgi:hypothetical protein
MFAVMFSGCGEIADVVRAGFQAHSSLWELGLVCAVLLAIIIASQT